MTLGEVAQIQLNGSILPVWAPENRSEVKAFVRAANHERLVVVVPTWHSRLVADLVASSAAGFLASCPTPGAVIELALDTAEPYVDSTLVPVLLRAIRVLKTEADGAAGLSDRESEILELLASGLSNRDIGEKVFLSEHTVRNHLQRIYRKLGVHTRHDAVAKVRALAVGLDDQRPDGEDAAPAGQSD